MNLRIALTVSALLTLAGLGVIGVIVADPKTQSCQLWAAEYGLTEEAVTLACETGTDSISLMTEEEYRAHINQSLNDAKAIIDETGGL